MKFDDGFAWGIIVFAAMLFLWPVASRAYESFVKAREERKSPEQRHAEELAAKDRVEAVLAKRNKENHANQ
jgi:hypothetical protein